jgi:hypothetical protein
MGCCGFGSGAARIEALCTDLVVQWLARKVQRGIIRVHGIGRRSFWFGKPQARSRLGEVIDIVPSIWTRRRGRSCRVDGSLWAIEKTRIRRCTFGVGITAAVATLVGYTSGLFYGFSLRVIYGFFIRAYFSELLYSVCLYMGPVARQVDYYQVIQSILCCAYITTIIVISSFGTKTNVIDFGFRGTPIVIS